MRHPFTFVYAGFPLDGDDGYGCRWTTEDEDGWWSAAPIRSGQGEGRSGQDGEWPETPLRGARVVTLRGKVRTDDGLGVLEMALRRLAAVPVMGEFAGTSEPLDLTLSGAGQLVDAPSSKIIHPALATWALTVKLPDPLLYGPELVLSTGLSGAAGTGRVWSRVWPRDWGVPPGETPGAIVVPNDGTAAYWPRLRINGPVPNPIITLNETGDWVRIGTTVDAGQWLDIDLGNRRVLLNGQVSQTHRVTYSGRWLGVPVGGGSLSWSADAADPDATLNVIAREGAFQ